MQKDILDQISHSPVIPVFYHQDPGYCCLILDTCYSAGIRVFEFVNRGAQAARNFEILNLHKQKYYPEMTLGIGTIKTAEQVLEFSALGAEFIVSPIVSATIAEAAKESQLFWIPGCMSPTEIALAESMGTALVKLFPGDVLGPTYLKAIRPLFPNLNFMPTGGVTIAHDNVVSWKEAGVFSIGVGSKLFEGSSVEEPAMENVEKRCNDLLCWMKSS